VIRNEREYQDAVQRLEAEKMRLRDYRAELTKSGLDAAAVKRAMDPIRSFHLQLAEEVEYYERLKRGDPGALHNLSGLGRFLIGLRIAMGVTQRELASRLGVDESQVSRDERNEYHGVSIERATRVLDALGVELITKVRRPLRSGEGAPELATQ
jgi:DNA-binding XRE family transcriptional regulator